MTMLAHLMKIESDIQEHTLWFTQQTTYQAERNQTLEQLMWTFANTIGVNISHIPPMPQFAAPSSVATQTLHDDEEEKEED